MSKRQVVVALSTTEVEYMAATHASKEAVWLHRLCSRIGFEQQAMRINCDSQSAIFLEKNPTYHSRMKHIDVQYHFMRDMVERQEGVAREGRHFGKHCRLFDQVCECCEVLLV
jgi:hypothetical protein